MAGFRDRGARRRIDQYVEHADRVKVRQGVALGRCSSSLVQFPRYSIELRNQTQDQDTQDLVISPQRLLGFMKSGIEKAFRWRWTTEFSRFELH